MLSDPDKKKKYDMFGHAGIDPNYNAGGAGGFGGFGGGAYQQGGFEDIFDIFGGMFGGGSTSQRARTRNAPMKGKDLQKGLTITFEEAAFGTKKQIKLTKYVECKDCKGTGARKGTTPSACPTCSGS